MYAQKCVESTIAASEAAGFDYVYAQVHPGGRWSFPSDLSDATLEACAQKSVKHPEGIRILSRMGVDVAVPHMFCYPGMTTYRSLLDLLQIPFMGCSPEVMAVSTNKQQTKAICAAQGVPVPRGELLRRGHNETPTLSLPLVVKPCSEDNSQGITLARDADELSKAIEDAFAFDDELLVEEFVPLGRELRVGVVEDQSGEPTVVLPTIEYHLTDSQPIRSSTQKLNVDEKGIPTSFHQCSRSIPGIVDEVLSEKLADAVKRAHKALGCRDYSLYDFRISPDGEPYMLEACLYCSFAPTSVIVLMSGCLAEQDSAMSHFPLFHSFLRRAIARSPALVDATEQAKGMKVRRTLTTVPSTKSADGDDSDSERSTASTEGESVAPAPTERESLTPDSERPLRSYLYW